MNKQLVLPFKNDFNTHPKTFRPIHYLGSKLRILNFIESTINDIDPSKGRVCDLFAGSGTVSYKLSLSRSVTTVDIQKYSSVLCSALLTPYKPNSKIKDEFLEKCRNSNFTKDLFWAINPLFNYEKESLIKSLNQGESEDLCDILENGSLITVELLGKSNASKVLSLTIKNTFKRLKERNIQSNDSISLRYFGGAYFSYFQCYQIDSILRQIDNILPLYRNYFLACLLSTVSDVVNTVGKQFAQPLRPRNSKGIIKSTLGKSVNKDRTIDVFKVYEKWLKKYSLIKESNFNHIILNSDFSSALDRLGNDVKVVYADPPYTRDHYSRFYHVLETIALRDLPKISTMKLNGKTLLTRGLYRVDRHQSPFCIKSQAPKAFSDIFLKTKKINSKLILSYSPYDDTNNAHPRVVTLDFLTSEAKKYYKNVDIVSAGNFSHSKLTNTKNHKKASKNAEVLIICE